MIEFACISAFYSRIWAVNILQKAGKNFKMLRRTLIFATEIIIFSRNDFQPKDKKNGRRNCYGTTTDTGFCREVWRRRRHSRVFCSGACQYDRRAHRLQRRTRVPLRADHRHIRHRTKKNGQSDAVLFQKFREPRHFRGQPGCAGKRSGYGLGQLSSGHGVDLCAKGVCAGCRF